MLSHDKTRVAFRYFIRGAVRDAMRRLEICRLVALLEELRGLRRDLDELGDSVAAALLDWAERCLLA
jgi:hypothetical protein